MKERIFFDGNDSVTILSYKNEVWKKLNTELYPDITLIYHLNMISNEFNDYRKLDNHISRNT